MAHYTYNLTYDQNADAVQSDPKVIKVDVGDNVTFTSSQGPVNVLFIPAKAFSAEEFNSGDQPVCRLLAGPTKICCGVVIDGTVWGFPEHRRFGHQVIPETD